MKIGIIVDSSASLPLEMEAPSIRVVPHFINYENHSILDFANATVANYIRSLDPLSRPKTAHPSPNQFLLAITDLLANGYDTIIILTVSSKISGTYNSALLGRAIAIDDLGLREESIRVIDTDQLAMGHGLIAVESIQAIQTGYGINQLLNMIEQLKKLIHSYYLVSDISFLIAGGRIKLDHFSPKPIGKCYLLEISNGQLIITDAAHEFHKLQEKFINRLQNEFAPTKICKFAINYVGAEEIIIKLRGNFQNYVNNEQFFQGPFSAALSIHLGYDTVGVFGWVAEQ
jgi:DegV family protein with EDD domain